MGQQGLENIVFRLTNALKILAGGFCGDAAWADAIYPTKTP